MEYKNYYKSLALAMIFFAMAILFFKIIKSEVGPYPFFTSLVHENYKESLALAMIFFAMTIFLDY